MKLSEAIRMGSLLVEEPAAFDFTRCAIGMALLSVGKEITGSVVSSDINSEPYKIFLDTWPWLATYRGKCPWCEEMLYYSGCVYHVFDSHVMGMIAKNIYGYKTLTIEQLADFIATIEPKDEDGVNADTVQSQVAGTECERAPVGSGR